MKYATLATTWQECEGCADEEQEICGTVLHFDALLAAKSQTSLSPNDATILGPRSERLGEPIDAKAISTVS